MKDAEPIRSQLIESVGECQVCGHSPKHPHRGKPAECSNLACHELLGGPLRDKTLDEPCGLLVVCWLCNGELEDRTEWPHARQLSLILRDRPDDYDLERFCWLRNENAPRYVEQHEVEEWLAG